MILRYCWRHRNNSARRAGFDHFVDVNKMIGLDSTGRREAEDGGRTALTIR
jgi:hypothetical protein